jgi:hypothetical protein
LSVKEGELDAGGAPAVGADGVVPRRLLPEQPDASSARKNTATVGKPSPGRIKLISRRIPPTHRFDCDARSLIAN